MRKFLDHVDDIRPEVLQADYALHGLDDLPGGFQAGASDATVDFLDIAAVDPDAVGQFHGDFYLHG